MKRAASAVTELRRSPRARGRRLLGELQRHSAEGTRGAKRGSSGRSPRPPGADTMVRAAESGLSLLECAASLAIAALFLASTTRISQATATLLRLTKASSDTIDVARNLLEHELGSPCAAPFACPDGYRCTVTRSPVTAAADRIVAGVERSDGEASEELDSLAPAPACGS